MTDNSDKKTPAETVTGYKHPPVKSRFQKGQSGNVNGRPKGSRNLVPVLSDVLNQPVTLRNGNKTRQVPKGEALIGVLLNMASKGERQAVDAVINFLGKIERLVEPPEEQSKAGVMVVPGVAKSVEEYKEVLAKYRIKKELQDQERKLAAAELRKKEADLRETIALHKGTPEGDVATVSLAELTSSREYRSNFYIKCSPEEPILQKAPHPVYRRLNNREIWSSVPWSQLPPDDPRLRDEPLSDGRLGK